MIAPGRVPGVVQLAGQPRPHPFAPQIATDAIVLTVSAGVPVTVKHGLGRQIAGWLVIWQTAACGFYVQTPTADTSREIVLVPTASASVRLVLL